MKHFSPQEFKAKAMRSPTWQGSRQAAGIIPAPSAQEKAKGEQEGRRVCIKSMADKFGPSTPSGMARLMLDKRRTTALGKTMISKLMTLQENSPFCQIFQSISLQVTGISSFPKLPGYTLSPGKQEGPWQKRGISGDAGSSAVAGVVSPSPCPVQHPLQRDTKEVFRYVPRRSFVLCLLPGSRTATVSMVSVHPIPVPGCETT